MDLTDEQTDILQLVRDFVDRDVLPYASDFDHADEFPDAMVKTLQEMGLFGITISEEHGGLGLDLLTYALVVKELSRGWISLSGVINTHFMAAWMIEHFGTDEQRAELLPRMAAGTLRSAYAMTEPHAGSDVQSIRTRARRDGDEWVIDGQKMWVTNGLRAGMVMLLAVTDPAAEPKHRGMTAFILEKQPAVAEQPGLTVPPSLKKLGYKGVESTELVFDGFRAPASAVLGGEAGVGQGFKYFMQAVELGRVNVAARAVGVATCAFEQAIRYAQQRETFGKPIAQHQAILFQLAEMATKVETAHAMMVRAARMKDRGERNDVEAGMAKYLAAEYCNEVVQQSFRIHGGYGYSKEFEIERLYREAAFLLIGEGTAEIQKMIIGRSLLKDYQL